MSRSVSRLQLTHEGIESAELLKEHQTASSNASAQIRWNGEQHAQGLA